MSANQSRDGFATKLGVLTATLGSAVGLGNIWKFPYMAGENGGAAFLCIYIAATIVVGLPIMISEIMMGRHAKSNAISTWRKVAPNNRLWTLVGVSGVVAAFAIMAFYTDVVGWVFNFIVMAITGGLNSTDPKIGEAAFNATVSSPMGALLWQWGVLALVSVIIIGGVTKGIEKTTKTLMPILLGMLILVCIRSLTLPKAGEGLAFLFNPDFSKVTGEVVLMAMGLAFFKLSIGMGTMMTYGSYFRNDADVPFTATRVMLADLTVSILAGVAIFPAVFNYGFEPAAGPGLLFMTVPAVFSSMPFGQFFMVIFFVLTGLATMGAMLSLFEVPVAFFIESLNWNRRKATILTAIGLAICGVPATLSFSTMSDVTIFGLNFFDFYDYLSSNLLLPIGGFFIAIFAGWKWGSDKVERALSNRGTLNNQAVISLYSVIVKWITPLLVLAVLLKGLGFI